MSSDLIDDGETAAPWKSLSGRPAPRAERTSEGHEGGALKFVFYDGKESAFAGRSVTADETWDGAAGLSFWWKGDGSDGFMAVTLLDETFTRRHAALVGLRNKEWRRIHLRWDDFVPETFAADWFGSPDSRMKPSDVRALWIGRWFYLQPWSACEFEIDDIRLETRIETPAAELPVGIGMPRTLARLVTHEKVVIAALGDSITSGYRLEKPERDAWPAQLERLLRKRFDYKGVYVRNHGIGGLETRQALVLLARDIGVEPPDLAIVHFGYNDFSAMEERRMPNETQREIATRDFREMVRRIRLFSHGRTEVLLVATVPGADRARRNALDFFGQEAAVVAEDLRCAFTEAPRAAFRSILERDGPKALFAKRPDGQQDVSHPNARGQRLFAEALLNCFEQDGGRR